MRWLDHLARDLNYGIRMVRNARLISIAVVLTLGLGIGINSGIFTLINGILLRPRTDSDPASFARLYGQYWSRGNPRGFGGQFSLAAYKAISTRAEALQELAAWRTDAVVIGEDATRSLSMEVTCNFFSVYGLQRAVAGRLFRDDECAKGSNAEVAVISQEMWRDRFAADPEILGRTIMLNRRPFTVIGIARQDFAGRLRGPGVWVPYTMQPRLAGTKDIFAAELSPSLWLEGRLRAGHTREELAAEVNVIIAGVPPPEPDLKLRAQVTSGAMIEDPGISEYSFWIIMLILSGGTLLLLVSCASGAVLLLSRAVARQQEIAVRVSLGASRRRIVWQLLTENLLLSGVAGGLGIYLALQIPKVFRKLVPQMPHYRFTLDWHIFGYVAAATLAASLVAGLTPAFECLRQDVWISLKGHELTVQSGRVRWSIRDFLVISQVCFCVVLMVVSVMFSRAVLSLFAVEPGFETRQVLAIPVQLPMDRYGTTDAEAFYRRIDERLTALNQVEEVASTSLTPFSGSLEGSEGKADFRLPVEASGETHAATLRFVSSNYFAALGIPFVLGTGFPHSERDADAAVVSQAFAAAFWTGQNPIGQTVISAEGQRLRVIGVARDTHTRYTNDPDSPALYRMRGTPTRGDLLLVRFRGDPGSIAAAVKRTLRELEPQSLVLASTLRAQMNDSAESGWLIGKMLLFVAFVAAGLALLGIYGVVGYSVGRRTREFGIRAALGATPRELMRLVFASGVRPVIAGIVAGVLGGFVFSSALIKALREAPLPLSSTSPMPYAMVGGSLIVAALVSMIGHARRAASVQPLVALREE